MEEGEFAGVEDGVGGVVAGDDVLGECVGCEHGADVVGPHFWGLGD